MKMLKNDITNSTTVQFESKKSLPLPPGFLGINFSSLLGHTVDGRRVGRTDRERKGQTDGPVKNEKTSCMISAAII